MPVPEVLSQVRGADETHKYLDVIGPVSTNHLRDGPTEFCLEGEAKSLGSSDKAGERRCGGPVLGKDRRVLCLKAAESGGCSQARDRSKLATCT